MRKANVCISCTRNAAQQSPHRSRLQKPLVCPQSEKTMWSWHTALIQGHTHKTWQCWNIICKELNSSPSFPTHRMRGYTAGARDHATWDTAHGFSTCRNLYNQSLEMINAVIHWGVSSKCSFATKFWRLPPKPLGFEPDDMQWPFQPKWLSLSMSLKCNIFTQINVSWNNMLEVRVLKIQSRVLRTLNYLKF